MRIAACADLHGNLPEIQECDVLVIAGDICPHFRRPGQADDVFLQENWMNTKFKDWLENVPARYTVATWGNHDFLGDRPFNIKPNLKWTLLIDNIVEIDGVIFFGTPWVPYYGGWAFNAPRGDYNEDFLFRKYNAIPENTNVIISHGPPRGYGDLVDANHGPQGSSSFLNAIYKVRPALAVYGHIHHSRGIYKYYNDYILANSSIVNEDNKPVYKPYYFDYDKTNDSIKLIEDFP